MSTSPITFPQVSKVHQMLVKKGVDSKTFQDGLIESGLLADLAEVIASGQIPDRDEFRKSLGMEPLKLEFTVEYNLTTGQMIHRCNFGNVERGRIDWDRFPRMELGVRKVTAKLVPWNVTLNPCSPEEKLLSAIFGRAMEDGFEDGGIEELLTLAHHFPGIQRRFPVIACGSVAESRKHKFVPCIDCRQYGHSFMERDNNRVLFTQRVDGVSLHSIVRRLIVRHEPLEAPATT